MIPSPVSQERVEEIVGPRTPSLREALSVVFFFILCGELVRRLFTAAALDQLPWLLGAAAAGYIASDLTSGIVHWLFDTWGSPETPVVGQNFILPFRVHHDDPKDITRHGFVATNGNNCLVSLPVLISALALPTGERIWALATMAFILSLCLGVFATNQFHKWAHEERPPVVAAWLQRAGLILGIEHHAIHHAAPHDRTYCITSGWMNPAIDKLRLFRLAERAISAVTGALPRRDDLGGR